MKKMTTKKVVMLFLAATGFLFLLFTGISQITGKATMPYFFATVSIAVGSFLMIESGVKNVKGFKQFTKWWKGTFHTLSFGIGLLLVFMGVTMFPYFGALDVWNLAKFYGWLSLIGGGWALLETMID